FNPIARVFKYFETMKTQVSGPTEFFRRAKQHIDSMLSVWDSLRSLHLLSNEAYPLSRADSRAAIYQFAIRKLSDVHWQDTSRSTYIVRRNAKDAMYYYGGGGDPLLFCSEKWQKF